MHMADALVAPAVAATMYVASGATAAISAHTLRRHSALEDAPSMAQLAPTMAVMSALVFAGQMVNFTIPGTGSSGHLCGGLLLSALLGPQAGFLCMSVILTLQCLLFADGGLLALGANIWNMGFYGCFVGYCLIYRPLVRGASGGRARLRLTLGAVLGCMLSLQLGACSVVVETMLSGVTEIPTGAFFALMQPIHLAIGLVEGLITAAVLCFVHRARPSLLPDLAADGENRHTLRQTLTVLAVAALVTGGGLSLLASGQPDGLEWSLFGNTADGYHAGLALQEEHYGVQSQAGQVAAQIVEQTALLPDYAPQTQADTAAGTSLAGVIGVIAVALLVLGICLVGRLCRRRSRRKKPL